MTWTPQRPLASPGCMAARCVRAWTLVRRRADRSGHASARPDALAGRSAAAALGVAAHALLGHAGRGQCSAALGRAAVAHRPLGDAARELDGVEEPLLARGLL